MQTVSNNTAEQINSALFNLNAEMRKEIKALQTKNTSLNTALTALTARVKALEDKETE